jgi:hypothetical protein
MSGLSRVHAQRLRAVYRSAGWPFLDTIEIELLASGLLEQVKDDATRQSVRLTPLGVEQLARCIGHNRQARSAHEALVERIVQAMHRDGRIVWTGLKLRAPLPHAPGEIQRWKVCIPDVFSIRNTTRAGYLDPIVHEIKVSRADLLSDLKRKDKRDSYLGVGGQCWYVLGCDSRARPIGSADEIPPECGVLMAQGDRLHVARHALKRPAQEPPFALWMALAKSTPRVSASLDAAGEPEQGTLADR